MPVCVQGIIYGDYCMTGNFDDMKIDMTNSEFCSIDELNIDECLN